MKRPDIEEAAIALFASKGLARTTIRDIAERAGVTEGALYRYYRGKNEMAQALFKREVERFSSRFEGVLFDQSHPFLERLERAVRFIYEYYRDEPVRFSFILLTQHGFPAEEILEERTNPNDMVIRFVKAEMARGNIAAGDGVLTAALLMGAVLQPVVMHRYGRVETEPVEVSREVAASLAAMLAAGRQSNPV